MAISCKLSASLGEDTIRCVFNDIVRKSNTKKLSVLNCSVFTFEFRSSCAKDESLFSPSSSPGILLFRSFMWSSEYAVFLLAKKQELYERILIDLDIKTTISRSAKQCGCKVSFLTR